MTDLLDGLIRRYLEKRRLERTQKRQDLYEPTPEDLYRYLHDEMEEGELERMLAFIQGDAQAQALVLKARGLLSQEPGALEVPKDWIAQAKGRMTPGSKSVLCPHCGKAITPFKRPLSAQKWINLGWLLLALGALSLSFVFRRYFMQCLALAVMASIQWALQMRATKTQILIYKALAESGEDPRHRLQKHSTRL